MIYIINNYIQYKLQSTQNDGFQNKMHQIFKAWRLGFTM
jgi:hypothetical protein